jgi:hypothetical protein
MPTLHQPCKDLLHILNEFSDGRHSVYIGGQFTKLLGMA